MFLDDGKGRGYKSQVDKNLRMHVKAFSVNEAHAVSADELNGYSFLSSKAIAASEIKLLLIKNTHASKVIVINRIELETIGAAAANASAFWTVYTGGDYASGGTAVTPVNMHVGASPTATGSFYDATASTIVTSGTLSTIHKTYVANDRLTLDDSGMIVLPRNATLTISHTGSTAAGVAQAHVEFYVNETEVVG